MKNQTRRRRMTSGGNVRTLNHTASLNFKLFNVQIHHSSVISWERIAATLGNKLEMLLKGSCINWGVTQLDRLL